MGVGEYGSGVKKYDPETEYSLLTSYFHTSILPYFHTLTLELCFSLSKTSDPATFPASFSWAGDIWFHKPTTG